MVQWAKQQKDGSMNRITTQIKVGARASFSIVHISDTHMTRADGRDDARKLELANARAVHFPKAESFLLDAAACARDIGAPLVHTGDLIDFVSFANLDFARQFCSQHDCFMAAGNHEFSLYVGEAFEDEAYRNQSLERVQGAFTNDIRFSSRLIGGVNFVAIDNSYYRIEREQLDRLRLEVKRGWPIVLAMHTPLHCERLYSYMMTEKKRPCAYLMATPESLMADYPEYRLLQQQADSTTLEAVEIITSEPLIKVLLTGHLHADLESMLTPSLPQLVTGTRTVRIVQFT